MSPVATKTVLPSGRGRTAVVSECPRVRPHRARRSSASASAESQALFMTTRALFSVKVNKMLLFDKCKVIGYLDIKNRPCIKNRPSTKSASASRTTYSSKMPLHIMNSVYIKDDPLHQGAPSLWFSFDFSPCGSFTFQFFETFFFVLLDFLISSFSFLIFSFISHAPEHGYS